MRRWHTRAEIESGQIEGLEPIAWIDDPVEAFFLHVQGSARVRLRDGNWLRVGYAGHNGHTYRAIGRVLIERGALSREDATAPGIKAWLRANPALAAEVMQSNPRYVFFRRLEHSTADGPFGSLGVPLTPGPFTAAQCGWLWSARIPAARFWAQCVRTCSGARATRRKNAQG